MREPVIDFDFETFTQVNFDLIGPHDVEQILRVWGNKHDCEWVTYRLPRRPLRKPRIVILNVLWKHQQQPQQKGINERETIQQPAELRCLPGASKTKRRPAKPSRAS